MYEIFDAMEDKLTPEEIIEELLMVVKYPNHLKEEIKEYALEKNLCPECAGELSLKSWHECRGEHFGFPAKEKLHSLKCENCGWYND